MNIDLIPKINEYEGILDAAERGKLIIFIGAGIPKLLGCPSWKEFAKLALDHAVKYGCIDFRQHEYLLRNHDHDPRKLLSICISTFINNRLPMLPYESILKHDDEKNPLDIYKPIYKTNAIFITTNYDSYLVEAAKECGADTNKIFFHKEEDLLPVRLSAGNIINIHGSYSDPRNMVITVSHYFNRYREKYNLSALLKSAFQDYVVLFIGYGLDEYEILEYMINRMTNEHREIKHYMLMAAFEEDQKIVDLYVNYYKELGIKIITYSRNKNDYKQLNTIILEWSKEIHVQKEKSIDKINSMEKILKDE
jgi:hypothetical protein